MSYRYYTLSDYLSLFQRLMPQGRIWPRDPDSVQTQVLQALVATYQRLVARDTNLLVDSFPSTATELLTDWESALGLPDECSGPDPTVELRRAHVVARLVYSGGQSIAYFEAFANALGYPITITEFSPFCANRDGAGEPLAQPDAADLWAVNIPAAYPANAQAVLQCEITRLKPAHTQVYFVVE